MTDEPAQPLPPATAGDYAAAVGLAGAFLVTIGLAVLFAAPFANAGLQAFEDPDDAGNSIGYLLLILVFTGFILYAQRRGWTKVIQGVILLAVGGTVAYVVAPLLMMWGLASSPAWWIGIVTSAGATFALYKHPEWYVVDGVGLLVAAGAAAIFGISLSVVPVVVLLVALAVYDAIAVYKTKHMLALADSVMNLRLPVLLVVPKTTKGYSFLEDVTQLKEASSENKGDRDALFMGLGDLVMPTILVVSALHFGLGEAAGWGAAAGTMVGYAALMTFVMRGNPQAGLPLLNGGAILGFLVGLYVGTGSIVFW
ncbi:MAG: presenilin family intramembrane aspartyl protease PSH [Thermoplasmatota archaeon]